jgi:hypothetical protein
MNRAAFVNSEVTCKLPPWTLHDKVLICAIYVSSAVTTVTALVLLWRSFA